MRLPHSIKLIKVALIASLSIELFSFTLPAYALEGDVIRPYASVTYSYDDNLRRFSSKQQAAGSKMSDTVMMTGVGIILDKEISRQRIYVDIGANKTNFDRNSELDNTGRDVKGRWDWELGNRLSGKIEMTHKKALVPLSEYRQSGPSLSLNTRTQDRRAFEARWLFHPRWRARAALSNSETEYSADIQRNANLEENAYEVGVDYLSPSRSVVGVLYRHVKGTKPVQIFSGGPVSNDYDQDELKLNVEWAVTGKSKVQFLGGLVDRKYDEFSTRDFRKFNMRGNFSWIPTGKTGTNLSVWKENNAQAYVTSSYTENTGISVTGNWYMTSKLSLQGNVRYEEQKFQFNEELLATDRSDKNKNYSLALIYKPTLSFMLNASIAHSVRDSNNELYGFDSNSVALTGQYEF